MGKLSNRLRKVRELVVSVADLTILLVSYVILWALDYFREEHTDPQMLLGHLALLASCIYVFLLLFKKSMI